MTPAGHIACSLDMGAIRKPLFGTWHAVWELTPKKLNLFRIPLMRR